MSAAEVTQAPATANPDDEASGRGLAPALHRIRITYAKGEPIKYLSHLDLARTWERAFRRAALPMAHSQGFSPHPRFQIAAALPVGVTSRVEMLDVWLTEPFSPGDVLCRLRAVLPAGLDALDAEEADLHAPSLQSQMVAAEFLAVVHSPEPIEAIRGRALALLEAPSLLRRRQHKGDWQTYDLRLFVQQLSVETGPEGAAFVTMRLQSSPAGAGRPEEVLDALGLRQATRSTERVSLHFGPLANPSSQFDNAPDDGIIAIRE